MHGEAIGVSKPWMSSVFISVWGLVRQHPLVRYQSMTTGNEDVHYNESVSRRESIQIDVNSILSLFPSFPPFGERYVVSIDVVGGVHFL